APERLSALHPHSLKTRVLHFSFESAPSGGGWCALWAIRLGLPLRSSVKKRCPAVAILCGSAVMVNAVGASFLCQKLLLALVCKALAAIK
ncbi:MAG: hypothetical protein K2Q11_11150, partial [Burkholderiaceae bacterium]|nr:hypothetical protein [Burkholderiaceae bacterium]